MLYLESFGNPRRFARIARRVARRKPILVMKSGTTSTGARAASSHTAALAGSDVAVDALCRQAGVLRARTFGEFVDLAALLSSQPRAAGPARRRGHQRGRARDPVRRRMRRGGLELPALGEDDRSALAQALPAESSRENPVDMLGSATAASYEAVLPLLLADPGIDAVIALFVPPVVAGAEEVAAAISRAAAHADGKPLLACVLAAEGTPASLAPVPGFAYPETAVRALGRAVERAEWLRRPVGVSPALAGSTATRRERSWTPRSRTPGTSGSILPAAGRCSRPTALRSSPSGEPRRPARLRRQRLSSASRPSSRPRQRGCTSRRSAASHSTSPTRTRCMPPRPASAEPSSCSR